jgi:hypothetical protein
MLSRLLLWFSAVVFGAIGVYFLAAPDQAAAAIGLSLDNDTARTDVRATYGGMVLGVAVFFGWAALEESRYEAGLWSMGLVYGGLALGRVLAIAQGQRPNPMIWAYLAIELVVTLASVLLLLRR